MINVDSSRTAQSLLSNSIEDGSVSQMTKMQRVEGMIKARREERNRDSIEKSRNHAKSASVHKSNISSHPTARQSNKSGNSKI